MKKRVLASMMAAVMIMGCLAGCGSKKEEAAADAAPAASEAEEEAEAPAADGDSLKIGCVTMNSGADSYQSVWYDEIISYAKECNVELTVLDPAGDATKQANMVQDLINMNLDCIIVWPVDSEAGVAEVKAVHDAGIPVMTANTDVAEAGRQYSACYVGPSNLLEGEAAGAAMVDLLGGSGKIVEINYMTGYTADTERSQGMYNAIEGTDIESLDIQQAECNREKAQQVMENYLVRFAKGEIDAVYCFDDTTAIGAANAIEEAGRTEIKVIAAAAGAYGTMDYIKDGRIAATVMQSPIIETHTILDTAIQVAKGNVPSEYATYIETPTVTVDNYDEMVKEVTPF